MHKLRAGASLSVTLSQAPPCVGTNSDRARPAATAPARLLHAHVRKRTGWRTIAQYTERARGSAPRSPHPTRRPPSRLRPATLGAPRAYTATSPQGRSPSLRGSNTDAGFRFLTAVHKLRAGASVSLAQWPAPPGVGTDGRPDGPAAAAPARQLHARVRKRTHGRTPTQTTHSARGCAPRSPPPSAPAAPSPAAGDSGGAPRLHRSRPNRPFTIIKRFQ